LTADNNSDPSNYWQTLHVNVNDASISFVPPSESINISAHTTSDVNMTNAYHLIDNLGNNLININDLGNLGGNSITIQLLAQHGRLDFNASVQNAAITSGDNNKITITDTLENINNILKSLIFTPTVGFNGNTTIQVVSNNLPNVLTADNNSDPSNYWRTLTINVNDAAVTFSQPSINVAYSIIPINQIQIDDVAPNSNDIHVKLTATDGTLGFLNDILPAVAALGTKVHDNLSIDLYGNLNDINQALKGLILNVDSGFNGQATIKVIANNLANTNINDSSSYQKTFNINVNDSTVLLANQTQTVNIDGHLSAKNDPNYIAPFALNNENLIQINDPGNDGNGLVTVELKSENGILNFNGIVELNYIKNLSQDLITIHDSLSKINQALNYLTFIPDAGFDGATKITVKSNNAFGIPIDDAATNVKILNINVNDATISLSNSALHEVNVAANNIQVNNVPVAAAIHLNGNNLLQIIDNAPINQPTTVE
ncbi:MAG: hypothetical protein ACR2HS_06200, partial [Gammaproteobacteria bacterium]